jgi:hypothetical protein
MTLPTLDQWNADRQRPSCSIEPHPLDAVPAGVLCPQCNEEMYELPQVWVPRDGPAYRRVFCSCGLQGRKLI